MQVIPFGQLMMSLFSLVLPITLGMWIRYRFTKGAKFMKAVIVPFTLITVLFIFTVRFHHICRLQISKSNMKLFITGWYVHQQIHFSVNDMADGSCRIPSCFLWLHFWCWFCLALWVSKIFFDYIPTVAINELLCLKNYKKRSYQTWC